LEFLENNLTVSSLWVFALRRPLHHGSTPRGTNPKILPGIRVGYGKVAFGAQKV